MRCPDHPDRLVAGRCGVCGRHFCDGCLDEGALGDPVCGTCAPSLARRAATVPEPRRSRLPLLLIGAVLLASAGLTALLLLPDHRPPPAPDDGEAAWRDAWRALEETGLALELYRLREQRYPDRLEELVPDDLAALPRDPYARGGAPLRYGETSGEPVSRLVWSLGPDRLDQGGAPFDALARRGDLVYPLR